MVKLFLYTFPSISEYHEQWKVMEMSSLVYLLFEKCVCDVDIDYWRERLFVGVGQSVSGVNKVSSRYEGVQLEIHAVFAV